MTTSSVAQPVAEQPVAEQRVAPPAYAEPEYAGTTSHGGPGYARRSRGGRFSLATVGLIAALASAWGGIIPFVGPVFGYSADGSSSWQWNLPHTLLALLPGAVGVCLGLFVMARSRVVDVGRGRFTLSAAGVILMLCGAWFALGPWVWPVISSSDHYFVAVPHLSFLEYVLGYSVGTGVIIAACGGYVGGWASRFDRRALTEPAIVQPTVRRDESFVRRDAPVMRTGGAPVVRQDAADVESGAATVGSEGLAAGRETVRGDMPSDGRDMSAAGRDMPAGNGALTVRDEAVSGQPGTARSGV
jgi:hypothetical protein